MTYQVLARKWRPKKFQDVIGQVHITRSLQNAITSGRLGHAYLLTGTRGIGKTSVARLFAKALRCEDRLEDGNPCGKCEACKEFDSSSSMNFSEIDGASHNSVEDVRDLIGNVQYLPTSGKYKIYLIDEVHMLSNNAFNALLKTLEEPPGHVIFIFATTEPEKLLETVLSRCQRFDFRNAKTSDLVELIEKISKVEEINFESQKLIEKICLQGRGSVRDTLSLLDQVLSFSPSRHIDEETVSMSLGIARSSVIKDMVKGIILGDDEPVMSSYYQLLEENITIKNISISLLDYLYEVIQNIDRKDNELVASGSLDDVMGAELIWIFEVVSKDVTWVLDTVVPDKAFALLLQKVTLRRDFFESKKKSQKKKVARSPAIENDKGRVKDIDAPEPKKNDISKSWKGFITFLEKKSPPTAVYIKHGNLIRSVNFSNFEIDICLGFHEKDHLMHDYLNTSEARAKLKDLLKDYLDADKKIEIRLEIIKSNEAEERQFSSLVDQDKRERQEEEEKIKNNFLENPLVKDMQGLFNSSIDKVILKSNVMNKQGDK